MQNTINLNLKVEQIAQQLLKYPMLAEQLGDILTTLDVEKCSLNCADEAELKILELTRSLGKELLHQWAQERHDACIEIEIAKADSAIRNGKKTKLAYLIWGHKHFRTSVTSFTSRRLF